MKIAYDKATDSLYLHLADRPLVDSDEVNDGVVLDFDASGALAEIDVQHASKRMDINSLSVSKLPLGGTACGLRQSKAKPCRQRALVAPSPAPTAWR